MTKHRSFIIFAIAFFLAIALATSLPILAGAEVSPRDQPPSGPASDPGVSEPAPSAVNPLTGLPIDDASLLERRPLGIKISNHPRYVRLHQYGLTRADMAFEYYLEYGLTRFFAIFYSQDAGRVGPVRSARFFDEQLVRMYKSIFVFANADRRVLNHFMRTDLVNRFVVERPDNCPPMCRDPLIQGYNNLFTNTIGAREYADEERSVEDFQQNLQGLAFDALPPAGGIAGEAVETIYSPYSYNLWEYDQDSGRYLRSEDTQDDYGQGGSYSPLIDHLTGEHVSADNVVILFIPHRYVSETPEILAMEIWGYGPAYVFRDGNLYRAQWGRPTRDSVLTLTQPDGTPFVLRPGRTFFEVIGETSKAWQFGSRWRFDFHIP